MSGGAGTGGGAGDLVEAARAWLAEDPDPDTRAELRALLDAGDSAALADRFGASLQFGTAGLRGELGAGPNRMNRVTVMRASAGVAAAVAARGGGAVVVGFDARHGSRAFALDAAAVFAGAGLRAMVLPRPLPTPVLAFAVRHVGAAAGVMVTASHNPPRDNGYKVYLGDGAQLAPPVDAEISAAIERVGPLAGVPRDDGWGWLGDDVAEAYLDAVCALPLGGAREISVTYTPLHGVGRDVVTAAFERAGFPPPILVSEQAEPDPDFPTVAFPNPEEHGAMDRALATGRRAGTDLVIANDPDADRCAVAAAGERLTGDELGCLLAEQVLRHTRGADRLVATTIVSSTLLSKIAEDYGVRHARTLTGFKWIVRAGGGRFVYGYEEALGYCVGADAGPPVLDKDGVSAALLAAGLAAEARHTGRTLLDLRDDQAHRYGLHATGGLSIRVGEPAATETAMARLRGDPPTTLGGREVTGVDDLAGGTGGLPPTDVLRFRLAGDGWVMARPSGTEPKLKCYLEVVTPVTGTVAQARESAATELAALRAGTAALLGASGVD